MADKEQNSTRVLVPAGALGVGVIAAELEYGLALKPHAIAIDAGSTDSGAAYLAQGKAKYSRQAVKKDLALLMSAGSRAGIPVLVGTCGTCGCDDTVDWMVEIALEIAREQAISPRIAVIYSEQSKNVLKRKLSQGRTRPLSPSKDLDETRLDACSHIVALLGPEPYIDALEAGADIVLGGRTTDTAVLAAVPIMRGAPLGPAWHAAKIAECGGVCSVNVWSPGVMMTIDQDGFEIAPLDPSNRCTPETVSAHMLYENSNPFRLTEPGGTLDVEKARYTAVNERTVRVTGSTFQVAPYTMKLEGAGGGPFQTVMLVGIQDPLVLTDVDRFVARMHRRLVQRVELTLGDEAGEFEVSLRPYGWNAVSGLPPHPGAPPPREIGLMFVATAKTQSLATQIAKTCNPIFFHLPVSEDKELPSYGFPFSPAELERGQVFEFHLNHIVETDTPFELVRTKWIPQREDSSNA